MAFDVIKKSSYLIPSKTFLLGEYAVLSDGKALVATHAPYFKIEKGDFNIKFHDESPAGKILKGQAIEGAKFLDPHFGKGGFGASTAEFIFANFSGLKNSNVQQLLMTYYSLFPSDNEPSGADLCAQALGVDIKESVLTFSKKPLEFKVLNNFLTGVVGLIFKTNSKVKTHEHLEGLSAKNDYTELKKISSKGISAFEADNKDLFFNSVKNFSIIQDSLGLLSEASKNLIQNIEILDGVFAVRGCGAMGGDVLTVFCDALNYENIKIKILDSKLDLSFITSIKGS